MYLMMDTEISCKGHCESFSHFLELVSYTVSISKVLVLTVLPDRVVQSVAHLTQEP